MSEPEESLNSAFLRTMQIVAVALITGVLVFLGIVLYLVEVQHQGNGLGGAINVPVLSYAASGFLIVMVPLSFGLPNFVTRGAVQRIARGVWRPAPQGPAPTTDGGKLLVVRQTALIVGMALLEGVCFLGCIAYLLEGQMLVLVIIAIALLLMLMKFPTEGRVRTWLAEQTEELERLRQQG